MTQTTEPTRTHFIVQTKSACMPQNCWGKYRRVAVLEVPEDVWEVPMISNRAKDVIRVVRTWERLNVGTTDRCAYQQALHDAENLCEALNRPLL